MSILFGKRMAGFAFIVASLVAAVPGSGAQSSAPVFKPATSAILCQPGFVYRCGPHGCYCVRA
jgi:hypothetical protein